MANVGNPPLFTGVKAVLSGPKNPYIHFNNY